MTQLSPHFSLAELTRSESAARNDIDMTPSSEVVANLRSLCVEVLEPIRERAGVPIVVTSGFRPAMLNALVGGSSKSDHVLGLAADIHAIGMPLRELVEVVESLQARIPLKQAIAEFGQWLHVSVQPEGEAPRREFLTARRDGGRTLYELGMRFV